MKKRLPVPLILAVAVLILFFNTVVRAAEKIRVGYVAPSINQFLPWIANERGISAKYDLNSENILITGSPRLVQSLIAGDVDFAFAGVPAWMRARLRGAEVAILGTSTNVSSQKLMVGRNSKIHRLEELKGSILGVSQYGSEADTFARVALARAGVKPDKDITIVQLGGHAQVAAALAGGKLEAGVVGGLASLTAERSGARLVASAADLKILSPSGTFATTHAYIQRKRGVVDRVMRSYVEAIHYLKTNRTGTIALMQKYMGGLNVEEASYLYHEQADFFDPL